MGIDYYEILVDDVVVACKLTREWLFPFIQSVFDHFYAEPDLEVIVRKMEKQSSEDHLVRCGHWIEMDSCMSVCSECNGLGCGSAYCPNCGAKMEVNNE